MQVGSKVKCIRGFENTTISLICDLIGYKMPIKNNDYIILDIFRCGCGKHDNLVLDGLPLYWDANHFRELIPPANVDNVLKEIFKTEKVYEEHLEEIY